MPVTDEMSEAVADERPVPPAPLPLSDAEFRTFADHVPTLCWIADETGWIHWYNRRWYEYTGTTPREMEGWGWQSVHDPSMLPSVLDRWTASITSGQPFEMAFPLKRADGVFRPFLTRVQPYRDAQGRIVRWFGTNSEISEQLEAERALSSLEGANALLEAVVAERTAELNESNEEMQRYAYIVSHDLRSPLVNIMGFTSELEALRSDFETISSGAPDPAFRDRLFGEFDEAIGFIKAAIGKMEGLISAILRVSREGRRTFQPRALDMNGLVRNLVEAQQHQITAADAQIRIDDLPAITCDEVAVGQIFGNLIDNGVKYLSGTRPGLIEIFGELRDRFAIYRIRDNGRGIAAADQARVFELFRRAGAQDRPGEGIGLAHVRSLVRSLGGRISLTSQEDVGTVFTVTLPREPAATLK